MASIRVRDLTRVYEMRVGLGDTHEADIAEYAHRVVTLRDGRAASDALRAAA